MIKPSADCPQDLLVGCLNSSHLPAPRYSYLPMQPTLAWATPVLHLLCSDLFFHRETPNAELLGWPPAEILPLLQDPAHCHFSMEPLLHSVAKARLSPRWAPVTFSAFLRRQIKSASCHVGCLSTSGMGGSCSQIPWPRVTWSRGVSVLNHTSLRLWAPAHGAVQRLLLFSQDHHPHFPNFASCFLGTLIENALFSSP